MPRTVVFGASGFIGRHLIDAMNPAEVVPVTRARPGGDLRARGDLAWAVADLSRPDSLPRVLTPGCTVINAAYAPAASTSENIAMAEALVAACLQAQVGRLVHCSTAVVIGDRRETLITEETPCSPVTPYEVTKHRIERVVLDAANNGLPVFVLRPTAVLGAGGQNLRKLLLEILRDDPIRNFARSSIYGRRAMNLVPVKDVVGALLFLSRQESAAQGIYICAADDDSDNRYDHVEHIIRNALGKSARLPALPLPLGILNNLLRVTRAGSARLANRTYSSAKLAGAGFRRKEPIAHAIEDFVRAETARLALPA